MSYGSRSGFAGGIGAGGLGESPFDLPGDAPGVFAPPPAGSGEIADDPSQSRDATLSPTPPPFAPAGQPFKMPAGTPTYSLARRGTGLSLAQRDAKVQQACRLPRGVRRPSSVELLLIRHAHGRWMQAGTTTQIITKPGNRQRDGSFAGLLAMRVPAGSVFAQLRTFAANVPTGAKKALGTGMESAYAVLVAPGRREFQIRDNVYMRSGQNPLRAKLAPVIGIVNGTLVTGWAPAKHMTLLRRVPSLVANALAYEAARARCAQEAANQANEAAAASTTPAPTIITKTRPGNPLAVTPQPKGTAQIAPDPATGADAPTFPHGGKPGVTDPAFDATEVMPEADVEDAIIDLVEEVTPTTPERSKFPWLWAAAIAAAIALIAYAATRPRSANRRGRRRRRRR